MGRRRRRAITPARAEHANYTAAADSGLSQSKAAGVHVSKRQQFGPFGGGRI
jgi:hypothetical protein